MTAVRCDSLCGKRLLTLEHVNHVLEVNEGVVDGNDVGLIVDDRVTEDDTSDTTEAVRCGGERPNPSVSIGFPKNVIFFAAVQDRRHD